MSAVRARVLHRGEAEGPVLALSEPLSFWGGFDPETGVIVDSHHPQRGACLAGTILLIRETRGSGGTPGGLAEAVRRRTGPVGIILVTPDVNLSVGAQVASALYGRSLPVLAVTPEEHRALSAAPRLRIFADGRIEASADTAVLPPSQPSPAGGGLASSLPPRGRAGEGGSAES